MLPLHSRDLQTYLDRQHVNGQIIHCPEPTPTVDEAARVMGVHTDQIVKSVLFLIARRPVLVITNGNRKIDRRPLADHFGVGKKQVKLADAADVVRLTGYPAGALPPFGHNQNFMTIADPGMLAYPLVYAGGGEENCLMQIDPRQIVQSTQAELIKVTEQDEQTS